MKKHLYKKINLLLFKLAKHFKFLTEINPVFKVNDLNNISSSAMISNANLSGDIKIGHKVRIHGGVLIQGKITIEDYTVINGPNTSIYSGKSFVQIGKFCSIARNVSFQEYYHNSELPSTYLMNNLNLDKFKYDQVISKGPITIGNDVWIGMNSSILSGVTIGDGAIIAAHSLVNKDVQPYTIVAGVPAKFIDYRFNKDKIEFLKKLKWWDWEIRKIKDNIDFFQLNIKELSIDELLKYNFSK